MSAQDFVVFVPVLALLGALICGLGGRRLREPLPGIIATLMVATGFGITLFTFFNLRALGADAVYQWTLWPIFQAEALSFDVGLYIDSLTIMMMLVITGVSTLIHLYSIGYMHNDLGYARYFMALNLFVAAMLLLVMADSYLLMFVGWEGVGVCSYLLIGFWFENRVNADAARKAFITNRVGDAAFLLGMFLLVSQLGTLNIATVNAAVLAGSLSSDVLLAAGLLFLLGACGKSAQIPLHVWLPDAMAGPTPVSALIHAATMVTAGVYLVARSAPLFASTPEVSAVVAWVGTATALLAALLALSQRDIKKILAYSTISQLGYMFAAAGAGAYWVAIFHVFTHAFFKALLFLASGSVIHALQGEQNITRMGALRQHMPITAITALIGTLAISGVPLLAGFFSKDAILSHMFTSTLLEGYGNYALYLLLLITAGLTAFYMMRWYYCVFEGQSRLTEAAKAHVHESPWSMTVPLIILAIFSVGAGYIGMPEFAFANWVHPWLAGTLGDLRDFHHLSASSEWLLMVLSVVVALSGLFVALVVYRAHAGAPLEPQGTLANELSHVADRGAGFDDFYRDALITPFLALAQLLARFDKGVRRAWQGLGQGVNATSRLLRTAQSGFVRAYAFLMFLGLAVLVIYAMLVGGAA